MFGTWKHNAKSGSGETTQVPVDTSNSRPVVQQACDSCRGRKAKCSGEKPSCTRCKSLSKPCVYTPRTDRNSNKRRKTGENDASSDLKTQREQPEHPDKFKPPDPLLSQSRPPSSQSLTKSPCPVQPDLAAPSSSIPDNNNSIASDFGMNPMPGFTMENMGSSPISSFDQLGVNSSFTDALCLYPEALSAAGEPTPREGWADVMNTDMLSKSDAINAILASLPFISSSASAYQPLAQPAPPISPPASDLNGGNPKALPQPAGSLVTSNPAISAATRQESCLCLQHVAFLVHELEMGNAESLDEQLVSYKEAVDYGQTMMVCENCSRRPEYLMFFTFLSDRLLQLAETVTERITTQQGSSSSESHLPVAFGGLEVVSGPEWELLVSMMVVLQLGALQQVLGQLKASTLAARAEVVHAKATKTDQKLDELIQRITSKYKRS